MSISGYQPKAPAALSDDGKRLSLVAENGTYIVKPPHPGYLYINENEHLTMCLARLVGIHAAEHGLIEMSDGVIAYVTKRFDRPTGGGGPRLHAMDFCQLTGKDPDEKYLGTAAECATLTLEYGGQTAVRALYKLFIFSDWIRNGDLHLKNLMLIENGNEGYALSPAYDLVCTPFYNSEGFKLAIEGDPKNITRKTWLSFGQANCQLSREEAENILDTMLAQLNDAKSLVDRSAFPKVEWKNKYKHWLEKKTRHLAGFV